MAAGTINTVVGCGSLITFPTLVALGYSPLLANVSNNIGLVPGAVSGVYGYRRELAGQGGASGRSGAPSVPARSPGRPCCWCCRQRVRHGRPRPDRPGARAGRRCSRRSRGVSPPGATRREHGALLVRAGGRDGVYGGYFGAAQGIILISILGIMIDDHLQRLNGLKNVLAGSSTRRPRRLRPDHGGRLGGRRRSPSARPSAAARRPLRPPARSPGLLALIVVVGLVAIVRLTILLIRSVNIA